MTSDTKQYSASMTFMRGLVIGAVLAAFFTPKSGDEMRRNVKGKIDEVKEKFKDKGEQAAEKGEEILAETQSKLERARGKNSNNAAM